MSIDFSSFYAQVDAERKKADEQLLEFDWVPSIGFAKTDPVILASALEAVRRRICIYGSNTQHSCDCKYGFGRSIVGYDTKKESSEVSGCPELRSVIKMLLRDCPDIPPGRNLA